MDSASANLLDLLHARAGLVCLIGAGGKKTTLYHLAALHPGRVGVTSTVYTPPFPRALNAKKIVADEHAIVASVIKAATDARVVAFGLPSTKRNRLAGLSCSQVTRIHEAARFDVTLVKCDGARGRRIKAPGADEPLIPTGATTVIPIVSARAMGQILSERIAHRVDRITAVTGARTGDVITPEHVARLLASDQGALKNVASTTVVPLINMVDNARFEIDARQAAELALASCDGRFGHVVLTSMRRTNPIVAVVMRSARQDGRLSPWP